MYGLDYDETFLPVVRHQSIRGLLAYGVQDNYARSPNVQHS